MINQNVYFIFDSQNVDQIQSCLYGFYVTRDGLFTKDVPIDDISDELGAWVLVKHTPEGIEISQDSIGCFGLFLYRDGDYWALSNSFNQLLDYLKITRKLSINKDYADAFLAQQLCVSAYGETIIKEIEWLDRRAQIQIDPSTARLKVSFRSLEEHTIPVDTEEGIRKLDEWHDKWALFLGRMQNYWPGRLRVDLSGGFDTRMALALVLSSGMDMDRIEFNSIRGHEEDYRIASLIAEEYGLVLNKTMESSTFPAYPPIGSFQERALSSIFFEKEIYTRDTSFTLIPKINISGSGGEMIRGYRQDLDCSSSNKRILRTLLSKQPFGKEWKLGRGTERIVRRSIATIDSVLVQTESNHTAGVLDGRQFYMETRNRTHFGMSIARGCLSHFYNLAPLLDPLILKLYVPSKNHSQLIAALIFSRYHGKLAEIPIEGGRTIPKETMQLACELNERYPWNKNSDSEEIHDQASSTWQVLIANNTAEVDFEDTPRQMDEQLIDAFNSPTVQRLFKELYGTPSEPWVDPTLCSGHPYSNKYAAVVAAKAMEDVRLGKDAHSNLAEFIQACCEESHISNQSVKYKEKDSRKYKRRILRVGSKIKYEIRCLLGKSHN